MTVSKKTATGIMAATLATSIAWGVTPASFATPQTSHEATASNVSVADVQKSIKQVDESNFVFKLSEQDSLSEDGKSLISDTGKVVALPAEATDKNGKPVKLLYTKVPETAGKVIRIQVLSEDAAKAVISHDADGIVTFTNYWKCPVGAVGIAGGGALTGAAAGATVGSALPGVGTAAGWVIGGAIGGAIFGGGAGAATFC